MSRDFYVTDNDAGDEFKQLAESHCQCDLTALFEEWVYEKQRRESGILSAKDL